MQKRSLLYNEHKLLGAVFIDMHGWQVPLHYGSFEQEHRAVRSDAGVFDISYRTVVDLLGAGGRQLLRYLLANDIDKLTHIGQAMYSCMLNQQGGIVNDLLVFSRASDNYRLVLSTAVRERNLAWLREHAYGLSVGILSRPEFVTLVVQGPQAIAKVLRILRHAQMDSVTTLQPDEGLDVDDWFFARTNYVGEDGLLIIVPEHEAVDFWQKLMEAGIQACGQQARDILRIEAGILRYGYDMDEIVSPLESGLTDTVAFLPQDRDFLGRGALERQKQQGLNHKMVALIFPKEIQLNCGETVWFAGRACGVITSACFSPAMSKTIALARIPVTAGDNCFVKLNNDQIYAEVLGLKDLLSTM